MRISEEGAVVLDSPILVAHYKYEQHVPDVESAKQVGNEGAGLADAG
jgi:hypothetical protein